MIVRYLTGRLRPGLLQSAQTWCDCEPEKTERRDGVRMSQSDLGHFLPPPPPPGYREGPHPVISGGSDRYRTPVLFLILQIPCFPWSFSSTSPSYFSTCSSPSVGMTECQSQHSPPSLREERRREGKELTPDLFIPIRMIFTALEISWNRWRMKILHLVRLRWVGWYFKYINIWNLSAILFARVNQSY